MPTLLKKIASRFQAYSSEEKNLIESTKRITGYRPINVYLYQLATQHSSVAKRTSGGTKESYERLEYLGDAVLGSIVAEFLFKKFPFKDEGFLTDIRSRIVNRESLNQLARKIGLDDLIQYNTSQKHAHSHKSLYGDCLESLIGAVYLDKGYKRCRYFVLKRLILPHVDLDQVVRTNPNHKSRLIEWAQKESREVRFEIVEVRGDKHRKQFTAQVFIDGEPHTKGSGFSKKKAEQAAASKVIEALNIE
ncbi:MAG: ribonuclease III [Bacteroidota bacterium]